MNRTTLDELARRLRLAGRLAPDIAAQLEDLYSIAYDRKVGSSERVRRIRETWYLDEIGEPAARELLDELVDSVDAALIQLITALRAVDRRLTVGDDADTSMRGTLLGGGADNNPAKEHGRLIKAQQRRKQRGEYTPVRTATQPRPGRG